MGKNTLASILIGLVGLMTAWAMILTALYWVRVRETRQLQVRAAQVSQQQNIVRGLLQEAMEYSKQNPAIDPILQDAGLKPKPDAAPSKPKTGK